MKTVKISAVKESVDFVMSEFDREMFRYVGELPADESTGLPDTRRRIRAALYKAFLQGLAATGNDVDLENGGAK